MGLKSHIEWTETTWNPVTGCTKISPGCQHCYAERMSRRLKAMGQRNYANGFEVTLQPHMLDAPLQRVFDVMRRAHWHRYQILTKRADRLLALSPSLAWEPHIWMGVSVESDGYTFRIDRLRQTQAAVKFLSLEPLLGPLHHLNLCGIGWVIVGGESGPGARPMDPGWVLDIRDQCREARVPFFFKQWGGVQIRAGCRRGLTATCHRAFPVAGV